MMKYCDEKGIAQVKNSILYRVYLKYENSYDWWHVNHACYAAHDKKCLAVYIRPTQARRFIHLSKRTELKLNSSRFSSLLFHFSPLTPALLSYFTPFPLPLLLFSPSDLESLFLAFTFNSDCYLTQPNFLLNNSDPIILF